MRLILVGELNPHDEDPLVALFPLPEHCAGGRLRRILGISLARYLGLARRNLCAGKWTMTEARRAAQATAAEGWDAIVMLGARVRAAFHLTSEVPAFTASAPFVSLPHPSGRNLIWNDPGAAERAREVLRAAAPGIPWGEES